LAEDARKRLRNRRASSRSTTQRRREPERWRRAQRRREPEQWRRAQRRRERRRRARRRREPERWRRAQRRREPQRRARARSHALGGAALPTLPALAAYEPRGAPLSAAEAALELLAIGLAARSLARLQLTVSPVWLAAPLLAMGCGLGDLFARARAARRPAVGGWGGARSGLSTAGR
jgi:Flp pilus assembly protein TadB